MDENMENPGKSEDKDNIKLTSQIQNMTVEPIADFNDNAGDGNPLQCMQVSACVLGSVDGDSVVDKPSQTLEEEQKERFDPDQQDLILNEEATLFTDVGNTTATVKIMFLPDGHMMTIAFAIGLTIQDLKEHFSNELKVPSDVIQILLNGGITENNKTLVSLGAQPHGTVQLEMSSIDPEKHPIRPVKPQPEYSMSDVITVRVHKGQLRYTDLVAYRDVVVEIVRAPHRKAFLGGYRHRITGTVFHHAAVQTLPRKRADRGVETFCRDTQTVETKCQSQQCFNNTSTQMTKIGCYVSNMEDKLISPGVYITADEYHSRRLEAVMVLQTHVRRWQAKRFTDQLRREKEHHQDWVKKEEVRRKLEKEEKIKDEHRRRMNPVTDEDFELLYYSVERWRQQEAEHINDTLSGPERKAALCALLDQETQFLFSVEQHRTAARQRNQQKTVQALLDKCAAPKRWQAFDGRMTLMDTQHTIRAQELRDLYNSVNVQNVKKEERLNALLAVQHTVKEHDCKLTRDIVELIDRETDLLTRGVKEANLGGLRKRISTLFLQYIKTPAFNPEVSRLLKVPQDPAQMKMDFVFCQGCSSHLPPADFPLEYSARTAGRCRRCTRLDNEARRRVDLSLHRSILRRLQQDEVSRNRDSKIPFLIQEHDLRYLVDVVWGARSALSMQDDMHDLAMVRWEPLCDWSPWNCILLTKEEASAHLKVEHLEKAYGVVFMCSVKQKHMLAQKYFSKIPAMAQFLQNTSPQPDAHDDLLVTKPITVETK
ncbi:IQ and ubiquitin-like domain-containing protein isoform X3 [Brienomyrus brachyistius]|uniref:IQ and ubiquitin-like domain-containing protein isoform X3 n=1 Tax=Brienomyrus brachyistius TaxID=42636 RepID=UPI0020B4294D|nr:IQ and ubiquitin-like domain-containing protein isoform X3 [Brienomyrus brachyistius]